jgi:hypothetical protein
MLIQTKANLHKALNFVVKILEQKLLSLFPELITSGKAWLEFLDKGDEPVD